MPQARATETLRIHLREAAQLYDAIDPAPSLQRDLDPRVQTFIDDWARELPPKALLALVIELPDTGMQVSARIALGDSIRAYFNQRARVARRELKQLFRVGRISLLIGLGFLALALALGELVASLWTREPSIALLRETVAIGGWVALWRPMEIFLYDWWPILANARRYERLAGMPVTVETPPGNATSAGVRAPG